MSSITLPNMCTQRSLLYVLIRFVIFYLKYGATTISQIDSFLTLTFLVYLTTLHLNVRISAIVILRILVCDCTNRQDMFMRMFLSNNEIII